MNITKYPTGWDAYRVQALIEHYDAMSDDELAAEDDAAATPPDGQTVITVPTSLLPEIRKLIASQTSA